MNITVIGSGNMGSSFVKQLTRAGHHVTVTARHLEKAQSIAAGNPNAVALPPESAAANAEIIVVATAYGDAVAALSSLGNLQGKIVIDITNPLTADYMGLTIGHSTSAAEEIAKAIPGANVAKAFNTVFAQVLAAGGDFGNGQKVPVFIASDSDHTRQVVTELAASMGFSPVDTGGLKNARYLEPLAGLNIYFGYGADQGTEITPTWIHKS